VRTQALAFDTPDRTGYGCEQELEMAMAATYRLQDILNSHDWVIERNGQDRYQRTLGQFRFGDTTAGGMLIEEGLARPWKGNGALGATNPDTTFPAGPARSLGGRSSADPAP
jgi:endonuclease YncB( thermonuclease family)